MGIWYEISRYNTSNYHSECVFNVNEYQSSATYRNTFYFKTLPDTVTYKMSSQVSLTYANQYPSRGFITLTVPNDFGEDPPEFNIYKNILTTDYDNFAIVWACDDIGDNLSIETAWVLSRERQINPNVQNDVSNHINQLLVRDWLLPTEQNSNLCVFDEFDFNTLKEKHHN